MHLEGDSKDKTGKPITYVIDGKQYVSLMGGQGTVVGPVPGAGANPPAAAAPNATPPLPPVKPKLLTFVLDGKAALPTSN